MRNIKKTIIKDNVRKFYGGIVESKGEGYGCRPTGCCSNTESETKDLSTSIGYSTEEQEYGPEGADLGLGCGNPQAIASLKPGETVLDLGSGAGFDCFLAARVVGPEGQVIGVDMTPEMLTRARQNAEKSEIKNIDFRLGEIENLPVADNSVDVVISNCVINLSPDKERVFSEAYRVLKKGGRLSISDIVAIKELPDEIKDDMQLYSSCISGASLAGDIEKILMGTGFHEIRITWNDKNSEFLNKWAPGIKIDGYIVSASIQAIK